MDEVLLKDGSRKRNILNYDKSQATKHAWKAKRFNFMRGIHREGRTDVGGLGRDVKKRVEDRKARFSSAGGFGGNLDNSYESLVSDRVLDLLENLADR